MCPKQPQNCYVWLQIALKPFEEIRPKSPERPEGFSFQFKHSSRTVPETPESLREVLELAFFSDCFKTLSRKNL